jgi:putative PIN family toxin of toxin-antitoxin system
MSAAKSGRLLRVVLDTNVYFSAFTKRGVPFGIWRAALDRRYDLIVAPSIVHEIGDALRSVAGWEESRIVRRLKIVARVADIVVPASVLRVVIADPDDDRILECAVAGNADLIVSGDRHLTKLKDFKGIGIVRPIDFLRTLA